MKSRGCEEMIFFLRDASEYLKHNFLKTDQLCYERFNSQIYSMAELATFSGLLSNYLRDIGKEDGTFCVI